jgi:hypothetical protein
LPRSNFLKIEVWTERFIGTADRTKALLRWLETADGALWMPEYWNTVEPIRKPYTRNSEVEVIKLWTQDRPSGSGNVYNDLMFRRKKPRMLMLAHAQRWGNAKLNSAWVEVDEAPFLTEGGPGRIRSLLIDLITWSDASYGYVSYSRQAHRRVVQLTPLKRLEQAYWLNFFGLPYLDLFGRDKVLNTPCHLVQEIPSRGLLLQATPRFDDREITDSEKLLIQLEEYLGPDAFAGRGYPQIPCRVPNFDLSDTIPNPGN